MATFKIKRVGMHTEDNFEADSAREENGYLLMLDDTDHVIARFSLSDITSWWKE